MKPSCVYEYGERYTDIHWIPLHVNKQLFLTYFDADVFSVCVSIGRLFLYIFFICKFCQKLWNLWREHTTLYNISVLRYNKWWWCMDHQCVRLDLVKELYFWILTIMIGKSGLHPNMDMDDARYRIKPYQQIASSCSGAVITSLTSKANAFFFDKVTFLPLFLPTYLCCCC